MAAWVKGGATDAGTAIEAAASLLAKARAPVIAGLSADVAAIRAAYDLAGRIGASDRYRRLGRAPTRNSGR
ncbi:hypothetical protein ACU4GR_00400 [Methylobacterium oryzae CBMB20]